jgi:hypothetical protein
MRVRWPQNDDPKFLCFISCFSQDFLDLLQHKAPLYLSVSRKNFEPLTVHKSEAHCWALGKGERKTFMSSKACE